ncbi:MAG: hypothetical protein INH43_06705 [Acidobacteriaceae bacterium]|nr:hypothetical protein [Acidobacteriaceae bacterium]
MRDLAFDRPPSNRRSTTTVDLGPLRDPFVAACADAGISPSEGLRRLIAASLDSQGDASVVRGGTRARTCVGEPRRRGDAAQAPCREVRGQADVRRRRVVVRLSESEWSAASELAQAEGFTLARWIGAGVRARLVGGAQLGEEELQRIADSSYQLRAIGRNLNQFVRAVNADATEAARMRGQLVADLSERIDAHLDLVRRLIESNIERWKVEVRR